MTNTNTDTNPNQKNNRTPSPEPVDAEVKKDSEKPNQAKEQMDKFPINKPKPSK